MRKMKVYSYIMYECDYHCSTPGMKKLYVLYEPHMQLMFESMMSSF